MPIRDDCDAVIGKRFLGVLDRVVVVGVDLVGAVKQDRGNRQLTVGDDECNRKFGSSNDHTY